MLTSLNSGMPVLTADAFVSNTERTVCITGHRDKKISPYNRDPNYSRITVDAVRFMLYRYIDMAIECGYTDFFSGLAPGTDLWAAEYILKKRENNKNIRLIAAMPYLRHAENFSRSDLDLLEQTEIKADVLLTVNPDPDITYSRRISSKTSPALYRDRNYFMVDNSSAVIAFLSKCAAISGTAQTVNYARRRGRIVRDFGIEDIYSLIDWAGDDFKKIGESVRNIDNVFKMFR